MCPRCRGGGYFKTFIFGRIPLETFALLQYLCCLLQLSARVLAGVEQFAARRSSSAWTIDGHVSWSMNTSCAAWCCSSELMMAFVVAFICGRVSWGMGLQGNHLRLHLVGHGRVCTGRRLQLHLRCLLQLRARVLAGVENCVARRSSSTWTICGLVSWSMDTSRGA
jgi:hypothetical protein